MKSLEIKNLKSLPEKPNPSFDCHGDEKSPYQQEGETPISVTDSG